MEIQRPKINVKLLVTSVLVTSCIFMFLSFILNSILIEISINPAFSIVTFIQYFGILFIAAGITVILKVQHHNFLDGNKK